MSDPNTPTAYEQAGVNVSLGDQFSSLCGELCRGSYSNSPFVKIHDFSRGHFRGRRGYEFINLPPGSVATAGCDGIGTKTIIADAAGMYFDAADNLLAMTAGDFTRDGCLPLVFLNDLGVSSLGKNPDDPTYQAAVSLMKGLSRSATAQGYVIFGGETAELSACISSENPDATLKFNWGGTMIGVMHRDKLITGADVRHGDRIIALRDITRSNGISLVRSGFRHRYGIEWYLSQDMDARRAVKEAATASKLYDAMLVDANGWTREGFVPLIKVHQIAHLSGGGIGSKLGDDLLFPRNWSAVFYNLWDPPQVIVDCAKDLGVSDEECYRVWGCGQGALVVVAEEDANKFIAHARSYDILARDAGWITSTETGESPKITIQASGFTGEKLVLLPKL